jgi:hypothetical protein
MEGKQQNSGQGLEPEQATAKAAILAECDKLARDGRTMVSFWKKKRFRVSRERFRKGMTYVN